MPVINGKWRSGLSWPVTNCQNRPRFNRLIANLKTLHIVVDVGVKGLKTVVNPASCCVYTTESVLYRMVRARLQTDEGNLRCTIDRLIAAEYFNSIWFIRHKDTRKTSNVCCITPKARRQRWMRKEKQESPDIADNSCDMISQESCGLSKHSVCMSSVNINQSVKFYFRQKTFTVNR